MLICSITYESAAALLAANSSLTWSTDLAVNTDQQGIIINQEQYISVLNITAVDSSVCGTYTCTAVDIFVAQESTDSAIVDVGMWTKTLFLLIGGGRGASQGWTILDFFYVVFMINLI